jgi:hypothetical protein
MRSASRPRVWFWIIAAVAAAAVAVAPGLYRTAVLGSQPSSPNGCAGMYLSPNETPPPCLPRI